MFTQKICANLCESVVAIIPHPAFQNNFCYICPVMLDTAIEYLKGVGPQRADVLKTELGVFTCRDLLFHFPFRYIDRTKFHRLRDILT